MKLLITGHDGFVGGHLRAVHDSIGLTDAAGKSLDILNPESLMHCLAEKQPDAVIHLAAQTFVPDSFRDPTTTYQINFIGTHNLLHALKETNFKGRFLFVSSADVYGTLDESELPATEATALRPLNPYAVSKIAAESLCNYWHRTEGLDAMIVRPFNHIGPGQSTRFSIADFSRTIAEIKQGRAGPVLQVGDLDVTRDFTDVRDVVAAYLLLLESGQGGETYNVCSGVERHLGEAVLELAKLAGIEVTIETDPTRLRKVSQRRARGSSEKLRHHTGWQPKISWQTSLKDLLDYWDKTVQ